MMRSEQVWVFISDMGQGGAQKVCSTLACELDMQGRKIGLLVLRGDEGDWPLPEALASHSFRCHHARSVLPRLIRWVRSTRPEVVLVFNHQLAVLLIVARAISGVKMRIVARNISNLSAKYAREGAIWHRHIVNPLVKLIYRRVDAVVAQSRGMAGDLVENYGFPEHKIKLIPNPVEFKTVDAKHKESRRLGCEFLFVGRLEPVKNLTFLLSAFSRLKKRMSDARLTFLGEGSEKPKLEELCKVLQISGSVCFSGWQNPDRFYESCDVTLLTSHYEGFPNVLIESMAHGKPVVSVDCPSGPDEVIQAGVNGFLVGRGQIDKFVDCMERAAHWNWKPDEIASTVSRFAADSVARSYWDLLSGSEPCGNP